MLIPDVCDEWIPPVGKKYVMPCVVKQGFETMVKDGTVDNEGVNKAVQKASKDYYQDGAGYGTERMQQIIELFAMRGRQIELAMKHNQHARDLDYPLAELPSRRTGMLPSFMGLPYPKTFHEALLLTAPALTTLLKFYEMTPDRTGIELTSFFGPPPTNMLLIMFLEYIGCEVVV